MIFAPPATKKFVLALVFVTLVAFTVGILSVKANNNPGMPPLSQDCSNTGLITTNDDWSGVASIIGYRGDGLTTATGVDP